YLRSTEGDAIPALGVSGSVRFSPRPGHDCAGEHSLYEAVPTRVRSEPEPQTVIRQRYPCRQLFLHFRMFDIVAHMRQVRLAGTQLGNHFQGFIDREMGWMRPMAQGIQHQYIQPFQQWPAWFGDVTDVRAIRDVADPEAKHLKMSVFQQNRHDSLADGVE